MMTREERAKQFAPYDAMKGLQEALREREERCSRVIRRDISDEQAEKNSRAISQLQKGMEVEVECHYSYHDITITGPVETVSTAFQYLMLGEEKINFSDIYSIEIKK